jgi:transcriptional regulator GlxA family with amidase domain
MVNREADRQRASTRLSVGRKRGKYVLADKLVVGHDRGMEQHATSPITRTPRNTRAPRQIAILVYPGVQSLDFAGPVEVFAGAQQLIEATGRRERGYEVKLLSVDGRPLQTSSGLTVVPHASLASALAAIDTLIVAGGNGSSQAASDRALLDWISQTAATARRTASVCTGAFLLAAAGLLDGRRATTHWASAAELAARYPAVDVDPEPIFLRDGPIWTSAGVTAGMDLALALVEEDLDRGVALQIARHLVLFLRRPGNQSQFSATLSTQEPLREPLREVQRYVIEHPATDLSVQALAARACMSPRHFARAFGAESGVTPARYVEQVRLEAARRHLEDTTEPIAAVAVACGFGTAETMRRVFLRALDVGPAEYRRRFHGRPLHELDSTAA